MFESLIESYDKGFFFHHWTTSGLKYSRAEKLMYLFNRNGELKKTILFDSTFEIEKVGSQFGGIYHDSIPAIPAADADSIVNLRSASSILVSTIRADDFQFDVHILPKNKQCCIMIIFFQIRVQLSPKTLLDFLSEGVLFESV